MSRGWLVGSPPQVPASRRHLPTTSHFASKSYDAVVSTRHLHSRHCASLYARDDRLSVRPVSLSLVHTVILRCRSCYCCVALGAKPLTAYCFWTTARNMCVCTKLNFCCCHAIMLSVHCCHLPLLAPSASASGVSAVALLLQCRYLDDSDSRVRPSS